MRRPSNSGHCSFHGIIGTKWENLVGTLEARPAVLGPGVQSLEEVLELNRLTCSGHALRMPTGRPSRFTLF